MTEWRKVKLGDCCTKIGSGATPKGGATVYIDSGTSFIRSQNVYNLAFDYNGLTHITEEAAQRLAGVTVREEDVLLNITGDSVARTCIVPPQVLPARVNQHVSILRTNKEIINSRYLNYYLASPHMQAYMLGLAVGKGASRNAMTKNMIENFEVPCPPLEIQDRVVTVLSRYDALIENYQRQIKLLEETAQRLYKEWFVDLRFPGHQSTPIINNLPTGWQKKSAKDFFTMSIGKTPPRADSSWFSTDDKDVPWVSISDMKDVMFVNTTNERLTHEACDHFNVKIVPAGTILLSFKLTVGRVSIADKPVCTNEAIAHFMRDGDNWREYTLMYLRNYHYDSLGNTSGISKAVNSTIMKNMPFVMPSNDILDGFSKMSSPIINQIRNLSTQIRNLSEARNRLLPKLMSGEIEV